MKYMLFVTACVLTSGGASGEDLLVPSQYPTIQSAVDMAQFDDRVLVDPGVYFEHVVLPAEGFSVESAQGPVVTVIDGGGTGTCVTVPASSAFAILKGFTLRGGAASGSHGGAIHVESAELLVDDCILTANTGSASMYAVGNDPGNHAYLSVGGCVLRDNSGGIFYAPLSRGGVGGCLFERTGFGVGANTGLNVFAGESLFFDNNGGVAGGSLFSIRNNTFCGNSTDVSGTPTDLGGNSLDCTFASTYCSPNVPHSGGFPGALSAHGSPTAADDFLRLVSKDVPANEFGYFVASPTTGFIANPGGSAGNFCLGLGPELGRFSDSVQDARIGGWFALDVDLAAVPIGAPPTRAP